MKSFSDNTNLFQFQLLWLTNRQTQRIEVQVPSNTLECVTECFPSCLRRQRGLQRRSVMRQQQGGMNDWLRATNYCRNSWLTIMKLYSDEIEIDIGRCLFGRNLHERLRCDPTTTWRRSVDCCSWPISEQYLVLRLLRHQQLLHALVEFLNNLDDQTLQQHVGHSFGPQVYESNLDLLSLSRQ